MNGTVGSNNIKSNIGVARLRSEDIFMESFMYDGERTDIVPGKEARLIWAQKNVDVTPYRSRVMARHKRQEGKKVGSGNCESSRLSMAKGEGMQMVASMRGKVVWVKPST